ncbi:C40 family peptidase [Haloglycomyces albus]|uniref:C40 family peptidase n=1 Tax=Haloglycomyces albus TaxID=526067 RepID=UPI00146FC65D|nr:NlpC/P60 family protein [Haloglycomyces albus]
MTSTSFSPAVITVSSATLWTQPHVWSDDDRLAVGVPVALRDWVAGLSPHQRHDSDDRIVTQLLLGSVVHVLAEESGAVQVNDPVLEVTGWVPSEQLTTMVQSDGDYQPFLVSSTATAIRDEPGGDVIMPGVSMSTRLRVVGGAYRGWVPVSLPGPNQPGWVPERDLKPEPTDTVMPVAGSLEISAPALQLVGLPYVRGGVSAYGLDSGALLWMTFRQFGLPLPRYPRWQDEIAPQVDVASTRPGDVVFFKNPEEEVAMAVDIGGNEPLHVVYASPDAGEVVIVPFDDIAEPQVCRPLEFD